MYVVGTAGHVDHGKSTLIEALTGIDPDRLPQEKERGMTIDLGFAWLTLPSGQEISIVDVPGHERFVRNMLAGVGGIDAAILVVAADEGVMPQTREHLAILDLLGVDRGLVAVTKADLVDDELLELASMEIAEALEGTTLESAPLLPVSAPTGRGLRELLQELDGVLAATPPRPDLGRPRLAVDRSFTVAGFGAVVTGSLIDGSFKVGQEVELAPSGRRCRIRGMQSHRQKIDTAGPGRRLAVNLSGVSHNEISRGEIVTTPGWLRPTTLVDVKMKLIDAAPRPMKHNARVSFHALVSESGARARLLDTRELQPGQEGWAQLHLADPVPLVKGDFFVLRSTETTLGGGTVIDPFPRRHRPFAPQALKSLAAMERGTVEELLLSAVEQWGPCDLGELARRGNITMADALPAMSAMAKTGAVEALSDAEIGPATVVYSRQAWGRIVETVRAALEDYYRQFPLRRGISREEVRSRLGLTANLFPLVLSRLTRQGSVASDRALVGLPGRKVTMNEAQERLAEAYLAGLESDPYSPPTDANLDPELLALLIDEGKAVRVNDSVVFSATAYQQMIDRVREHITEHGGVTVAEARTLLDSSRKYVLPLLEYLDQRRITLRRGDRRTLR